MHFHVMSSGDSRLGYLNVADLIKGIALVVAVFGRPSIGSNVSASAIPSVVHMEPRIIMIHGTRLTELLFPYPYVTTMSQPSQDCLIR